MHAFTALFYKVPVKIYKIRGRNCISEDVKVSLKLPSFLLFFDLDSLWTDFDEIFRDVRGRNFIRHVFLDFSPRPHTTPKFVWGKIKSAPILMKLGIGVPNNILLDTCFKI